jgi:hypothetical protein
MNEPSKQRPAIQKKSWLGILKWLYLQTSPTAGVFALGLFAILGAIFVRFFPVQYNNSGQAYLMIGLVLLGVGFLRVVFRGKLER